MHRVAVGALLIGLCLPAVTSCSGDPSQAAPETSPSTVSLTLTTPPTPAPTSTTAPTPPPVAREKSARGARAFVHFYMRALNSALQPPWNEVMRRYSTAACVTCRGIASSMQKIRMDHGFYRGGAWIVTSTYGVPLHTRSHPIMHTAITVTSGEWKRSPTDHLRTIKADKIYVDVHLSWSANKWLVTEIVQA